VTVAVPVETVGAIEGDTLGRAAQQYGDVGRVSCGQQQPVQYPAAVALSGGERSQRIDPPSTRVVTLCCRTSVAASGQRRS